jgi:hypothetical protein
MHVKRAFLQPCLGSRRWRVEKEGMAWTERGPIAPGSYNAGDLVWLGGRRILVQNPFVVSGTGPVEPWVSGAYYVELGARGVWPSAPYGVTADGTNDQGPALNALITRVSANGGGTIVLPSGYVLTSQTIVLQSNVTLEGMGRGVTIIKLTAGANCDVVQTAAYGSTTQAAILGVAATSLRNCFYGGLRHLTIHGSASSQAPGYHHGVNASTLPATTAAPSDPDFDPKLRLDDVWLRSCTGDGFYASGRSGAVLTGVVSQYNGGNGFSPSFDTTMVGCDAGMNGVAGWYLNWSSIRLAGCKSFNNGKVPTWSGSTAYNAGQPVLYGTTPALYTANAAVAAGGAAPGSNASWIAVTATSLAAWGVGFYLDVNCGEFALTGVDAQQNSASSFYLRGVGWKANGVIEGNSHQPNFNNVNTVGYVTYTANAGNYAALVLDGAKGVAVNLGVSGMSPAAYVLRTRPGATGNDVTLTGETTALATLAPDSSSLTGNAVRFNGAAVTG